MPWINDLVDVSGMPEYEATYQDLLKKVPKGTHPDAVRDLAKVKIAGLAELQVLESPEDFEKLQTKLSEVEKLIQEYRPTIQPTVDQAFNTKNHPFVTDPIGASIFATASEYIDRMHYARRLFQQHLGYTPRRIAELICKQVEQGSVPQLDGETRKQEKRGDLPDWLANSLAQTDFQKVSSKKELLDMMFPSQVPDYFTPAESVGLSLEQAKAQRVSQLASGAGIQPGTPAYAEIVKEVDQLNYTVPADGLALQAATAATWKKLQEIRNKFDTQFYTEENLVGKDLEAHNARYAGEHGVVRRAVRGFLVSTPEASNEDKVKFMRTLKAALRQRRRNSGIVLKELFPSLSLREENEVADSVLLKKFDEIAADL